MLPTIILAYSLQLARLLFLVHTHLFPQSQLAIFLPTIDGALHTASLLAPMPTLPPFDFFRSFATSLPPGSSAEKIPLMPPSRFSLAGNTSVDLDSLADQHATREFDGVPLPLHFASCKANSTACFYWSAPPVFDLDDGSETTSGPSNSGWTWSKTHSDLLSRLGLRWGIAKRVILNASNRAWASIETFGHMNAVGAIELYSMAKDHLTMALGYFAPPCTDIVEYGQHTLFCLKSATLSIGTTFSVLMFITEALFFTWALSLLIKLYLKEQHRRPYYTYIRVMLLARDTGIFGGVRGDAFCSQVHWDAMFAAVQRMPLQTLLMIENEPTPSAPTPSVSDVKPPRPSRLPLPINKSKPSTSDVRPPQPSRLPLPVNKSKPSSSFAFVSLNTSTASTSARKSLFKASRGAFSGSQTRKKQMAMDCSACDKPPAPALLRRTVSTSLGMTLEDLAGGVGSDEGVRNGAWQGRTGGVEEGIGVVVEEEEWEK